MFAMRAKFEGLPQDTNTLIFGITFLALATAVSYSVYKLGLIK